MNNFPRLRFFLSNFWKGMVWLALIALIYFLFMEYVFKDNPDVWLHRFYSNPGMIYGIYIFSEFFFGLIPPELFMIWAYNKAGIWHYVLNVVVFAMVSYLAGYTSFVIGQVLQRRLYYRFLQRRFFSKSLPLVRKYGLFLIVVAAATPVPFAASSLIVGASGYSTKMYLVAALSRLARFAIYGYIIFQSHQLA